MWRLLAEERRVPSYEDFVQIGPDSTVATTHPGGHEHPTVDRYLDIVFIDIYIDFVCIDIYILCL